MRIRALELAAAALLVALLPGSAFAQSNEEKLEAKMKKPFVGNAAWITDYAKAREKAAADGKLIFAYFTRSYSP